MQRNASTDADKAVGSSETLEPAGKRSLIIRKSEKIPTIKRQMILKKAQNKMEPVDREKLLDEFYIVYNNKAYNEAIELLKTIIHQEKKKSFWIYSRLSSCYYELKDYENALNYAQIAYKLKPQSPLVLWDYAGVLIMVKREKRAIQLLLRIQGMEDDLTIYGFPERNIKWMQSVKNDTNFLIGKAYYMICEDQLAKEYFLKYLSYRKKGLKTIYSKRQVLTYLKKLEASRMSVVCCPNVSDFGRVC